MTTSQPLQVLNRELVIARRYSTDLVEVLSADQVDWRPNPDSSAIAWHLGHQAAVNHYMVRNLTAAEPSFDPELDRIFDSATIEPDRSPLPSLPVILGYRNDVARSTDAIITKIDEGDVGSPEQLGLIASGLLLALINHEYQHSTWIGEVRDTMTESPRPTPQSDNLTNIDGYWVIRALRPDSPRNDSGCSSKSATPR